MKKKIIILAFLASCGDVPREAPQDAASTPGVSLRDAGLHVDAASPQNGCNSMGNLPNSRSKTYVDGDPVDPQILNEVQDQVVGAKRSEWPGYVTVIPYFVSIASGTPSWALPPAGVSVYCQSTNATNQAWFKLETEGGDQLRGIRFDAFGASSGTLQVQVFYGTVAAGVGSGAFIGTQAIPNGVWTSYRADAANAFGGSNFFVQPTLDDTNIAVVEFVASTVGVRIGNIRPILGRP